MEKVGPEGVNMATEETIGALEVLEHLNEHPTYERSTRGLRST